MIDMNITNKAKPIAFSFIVGIPMPVIGLKQAQASRLIAAMVFDHLLSYNVWVRCCSSEGTRLAIYNIPRNVIAIDARG